MKWHYLRGTARAYLMSITFWFGLAFLMGWQNGVVNRQHFWSSFVDLLGMAGLRGFGLALWAPPIFYLVGKYLNLSKNRWTYVLLFVLGAVPFVLMHSGIQWVLNPPYDDVQQKYLGRSFHSYLENIRTGFADQSFIYIAMVVAAHAYEYFKRLRREEREKYEYQQALIASELQALKMQLRPHFLFNTLNGIATLVDADSKKARAMIVKLSDLLRTALDRDGADLVSLQDELKFVKEYLDLEKMRFGSRLKIEWLIPPTTRGLLVPQMILQPLVENAIRHGVSSAREGGWVEVAATQKDGTLEIQVRNSVGGKMPSGTGVGLRNTETRLKYLYSGDASLHLTVSEDRIATASLILPALSAQPASLGKFHGQTVA
ncbi:MAG TPA: histidine kinase [Candidatus Sulfotelmatobacter sp.]|nr:histidine kinase [Candidatus Sulfotelmatobacter sp.]